MRIIVDDVGRPLTEFESTLELVCAVRDAIRGEPSFVFMTKPLRILILA